MKQALTIAAISAGAALLTLVLMVWPRCNAAPTIGGSKGAVRALGSAKTQLDVPPVQVRVTKLIPDPSHVIYRYEIVNGGAFPISGLSIGNAYYLDETELDTAPRGWNGDSIPQTPDSSVESPPGWNFEFLSTEGGEPGTADWKVNTPAETVPGGSALSGFAVVLSEQNVHYEEGHWTVYLNTNEEILYSGALQPSGVTSVPVSSLFAKSDLHVNPNPSSGVVGIQFSVPVAGMVSVDVFDAQGRLIRRVLSKRLGTDPVSISWDGRDGAGREVAAGVYFVRVKTPTTQRFARVTWLR